MHHRLPLIEHPTHTAQSRARAWLWVIPAPHYATFEKTGTFAVRRAGRSALGRVEPGDLIFPYLSGAQVLGGLFEAAGRPFRDTTPLVAGGDYRHRLRVRARVRLGEEARLPTSLFADKLDAVREAGSLRALTQRGLVPLSRVDALVLSFLVQARAGEMERAMRALDTLRSIQTDPAAVADPPAAYDARVPFDRAEATEALIAHVAARGFVYEPWQVAAYATALRTKPFVILAGVTGTGKTRLPALVAEATGQQVERIPVRPDWTDSAEVLGYTDLQGRYRAGAVLTAARRAVAEPGRSHVTLLDEMNLARVEHYLAELLSAVEDRRPASRGGFESGPLAPGAPGEWGHVPWPPNWALVGTVNMDESGHGFSRKVLDRAFTIELAEVDLSRWGEAGAAPPPRAWPGAAWQPRATHLAPLRGGLTDAERARLDEVVAVLEAANRWLAPAQLQVAYRLRDEVTLFVLHGLETPGAFRTHEGRPVDPLDLALHMKLLPRLLGGSRPLRVALDGLVGWAWGGHDEKPERRVAGWDDAGRPAAMPGARFPRTAARLALMWDRLDREGFTAFWV